MSYESLKSKLQQVVQKAAYFNGLCRNTLTAVTLPQGITTVRGYLFFGCVSLEQATLPDTVKDISSAAFRGCANLRQINLPEGLLYLRYQAFLGAKNLELTRIPAGIVNIESECFSGCQKLTSVTFLGKIRGSLAATAFNGCTNLREIRVPWSQGEIPGAPWGAENATVIYDWEG